MILPLARSSECQSGPQLHDGRVQLRADLPRPAHDHRLARRLDELAHPGAAVLPVRHQVRGQCRDPLRRTVDGVDDGDARLDARPLGVVQPQRGFVGGLVQDLLR